MTNTDTLAKHHEVQATVGSKVDVGFAKPTLQEIYKHKETPPFPNELPFLRLEALKLAYEVAYKQDIFNAREWANKSLDDQVDSYKQVFELAAINYQFIMSGKVDMPLISSLDEEDLRG